MQENATPDNSNQGEQAQSNPANGEPPIPKPRKKRWWLRIALVLLILLLVIVALAPTIASTAAVRDLVVAKVNERITGKLSIDDWSIGWTSGVNVTNVKVKDADGIQMLEIGRLHTPLSLIDAIRGKFDIGNTSADGVDFLLKRYADGQTNFQQLVKAKAKNPAGRKEPAEPNTNPNESNALPNVSGQVSANIRGTIEQAGQPTIHLTSGQLTAKITSLSEPISNQADLAMRVGNDPEGKVSAAGTVNINNNATVETVTFKDFPVATIAPFAGNAPQLKKLSGLTNGKLDVNFDGTKGFAIGELVTTGFAVGVSSIPATRPSDAPLDEVYTSRKMTLTIPKTELSAPGGMKVWQKIHVKVGNGTSDWISIQVDEGEIKALVDAPLEAILNVVNKQKPGADGKILVQTDMQLQGFTQKLPNTTKIQDGVKVTTANYHQDTKVLFTSDKTTLTQVTKLDNIEGIKGADERITCKPIELNLSAVMLPGQLPVAADGTKPLWTISDLRLIADLKLNLASGFAKADITAKNIGEVAGTIDAQLNAMQSELGQFVKFGSVRLDGTFHADIASQGDYATNDAGNAQITVSGKTDNLKILGIESLGDITQDRMTFRADATALRKSGNAENLQFTLKAFDAGNDANPSIDVVATAKSFELKKVGQDKDGKSIPVVSAFTVNAKVDLKASEKISGKLVTQRFPKGIAGGVTANASGSLDGQKATLTNLAVDAAHVSIGGTGAKDLSTHIEAAGLADLDKSEFDLSKLTVNGQNAGKMFMNVERLGDKNLMVRLSPTLQANGDLRIAADLQQTLDLARDLTGKEFQIYVNGNKGQLVGGELNAELHANYAEQGSQLDGFIEMAKLTVADPTTNTQPLNNENVRIDLNNIKVAANGLASVGQIAFKGQMVNGAVTEAQLQLPPMDSWSKKFAIDVWTTHLKLDLTADVAKLQAMALLLAPPKANVPAEPVKSKKPAPADNSDAPLQIASGMVKINLDINRNNQNQTLVTLNNISGEHIEIKKGEADYAMDPFSMSGELAVDAATVSTKSLIEQINQIAVNKLTGKSGFGEFSVTQPIIAKNLSTTPSASGQLALQAPLEPVMKLLAALKGQKAADAMRYSGLLTCTQTISTENGAIHLVSNDTKIADFRAQEGNDVFSESMVVFENDVLLTSADKSLIINKLRVDLQGSKALTVAMSGKIHNYDTAPMFEALSADAPPAANGKRGFTIVMSYDGKKVRDLLAPYFAGNSTYANLKLDGKATDEVNVISGTYPLDKPFKEAISSLNVDGKLAIAMLDVTKDYGVKIEELVPSFVIEKGWARIPDVKDSKTDQAKCNNGVLDLGDLSVNLTSVPMPHLHIPKGKFANNLVLNDVFAKYVNNLIPLFGESTKVTGSISLEVVTCDDLPLDWLMPRNADNPKPLSKGKRAEFIVNTSDLELNNPLFSAVGSLTGRDSEGLPFALKNAHITIMDGEVTIDAPLSIDNQVISFKGTTNLPEQMIVGALDIGIPKTFIRKIGSATKLLPDTIHAPLTGSLTHPEFDFGQAIQKSFLGGAGGNPTDVLGGILRGLDSDTHRKKNKDKDKDKGGAAQNDNAVPQGQQPQQPNDLGGLIGDLLNKHKDKDKDKDSKDDPKNKTNTPKADPKNQNPPKADPKADPKVDPSKKPADDKAKPKDKPTSKPATKPTDIDPKTGKRFNAK